MKGCSRVGVLVLEMGVVSPTDDMGVAKWEESGNGSVRKKTPYLEGNLVSLSRKHA